ncbi:MULTISPECIES: zeta toxin family protein [Variovorax]|uniref:zeta toxin family protein n=1 Tax=Variovorax TaxID=34072 RepID=UPI00285E618F|nr:zeta toxin family protein [Variovorax sp. 3319]MDR6887702.1 hypothetical protein [Variovorax sp. 3319]
MSRATEWALDEATHNRIYAERVLPDSRFHETTPQEHPRAIVLAGQPGAGKGGLAAAAEQEFAGNVVKLDLDEKRNYHPYREQLRETHPYTWASHTHQDARSWTDKLSHDFVEGRRNIVFDTTLGGADHWIGEMKKMQALQKHPYEVEVRVLATHRLESEHGVHERFTDSLEKKGYGRFVPQEVRTSVYDNLPANLDKVHAQLPNARIRIYNREGTELYDSRTSPLKPGAALEQAREARLTDPERTRGLNNKWQAQQAWEQQLPESLQRNPKVTPSTVQNVLRENSDLKIKADVQRTATEAAAIDRSVRIEPGAARVALGLKVFGTAALAHDALTTGRDTKNLLDQDNLTGAKSELLHFAGRNLGMAAGAMAVGSVAAAAGIETGPGALAAGLAGGLVGAVAGNKIMDALDQSRIYTQRGSDGNDWNLDPSQPAQGWTRLPRPGEFGPQGPPEGVGYKNHLMQAAPLLADELNYKASNVAVELALAHPRAPQDPFRQAPESIGEAVRSGIGASQPWIRDPQSHAWTRQATEAATPTTHGMPVQRTAPASPEQSRQLDAAAQRVIADNLAHSPQAIAQRYQEAYTQHRWKQHGPVPAAVTHAAQGPVREEPHATPQAVPAQPQPANGHLTPQQIERITTHESRIVPTPGGMSFAEAHKRRDEPEQISAGSLQPVGKLDEIHRAKGGPLYRVHQAQEQTLMRDLEIALAQDRDRFRSEPSPRRTLQPSVERTQERVPERVQEQEQAPAAGAEAMHSPTTQVSTHASMVAPVHSNPPGDASAIAAAQAQVAAAQAQAAAARAELAQMHQQMARMAAERHDGVARRDESDSRSATAITAAADTSRPLLRDFSDPGHPQNALYSTLKDLLPKGTSEERLAQGTAACHRSSITEKDLSGIYIGDKSVVFASRSLFAVPAQMDISQPAPSVQLSDQHIQQTEQQRAQIMSEIRAQNAAQANQQQGPVMG